MSRFSLEKYRIFPIIAWVTIILFAIFVFFITLDLMHTSDEMNTRISTLEDKVNQNIMDVEFGSDISR